ncbi:unnamed protein product [Pylaiella littoralis]
MAELPTPGVAVYVGGNAQACHAQFVQLVEANPAAGDAEEGDLSRALAFEIASKVGLHLCQHAEEPTPLEDMSVAKKKVAAKNHPGLCGVYHAGIIAAVKTQDVHEKWGSTTGNKPGVLRWSCSVERPWFRRAAASSTVLCGGLSDTLARPRRNAAVRG